MLVSMSVSVSTESHEHFLKNAFGTTGPFSHRLGKSSLGSLLLKEAKGGVLVFVLGLGGCRQEIGLDLSML